MAQLKYQVFLCFRGPDVRDSFVSFLAAALKRRSIDYFLDEEETRGEVMSKFLQNIAESRIVLVIFSENFMQSKWCIEEVEKALETRGPGRGIIPIFYKVRASDIEELILAQEGDKDKWTEFSKVTAHLGLKSSDHRTETLFVDKIVKEVEKTLTELETEEAESKGWDDEIGTNTTMPFFGIKQRVRQLQLKLKMGRSETRLIGVAGMKGVGKTKLAEILFQEGEGDFQRRLFFKDLLGKMPDKEKKRDLLIQQFKQKLLKISKNQQSKLLLVLDDFSDKDEIMCFFKDRDWITPGSKIVIVASDKSLVKGLVDDIYVVPFLNEEESLACLNHHAFGDAKRRVSEERNLLTLSRKFVQYARGNPLALTLLGKDLWGRDENQWEYILSTLETSQNKNIQCLLNSCYKSLNQSQKDVFLDVTCFFRSHDHKFLTTLVNDESIIQDLADKFLIDITSGRVEMHGLLHTLGKNLASKNQGRLWNKKGIVKWLTDNLDFPEVVRGIFVDMSEVKEERVLNEKAFDKMEELRYLKFFSSSSCFLDSASKLTFSNVVAFSCKELRYLHWLKFPFEELPKDFNPKNLIDLKLPYSNIKRLWNGHGVKNVTNLKWVDLKHSVNLQDVSGLIGAGKLERLVLEGCTELKKLSEDLMQTMTSLVCLNLRSCKGLVSLPKINIKSLKTLILSDCSNLAEFEIMSENLEALYLNGTALKELPEAIKDMQRLVILNMKDCIQLESIPVSLGKLKALQELILSGCSKLTRLPNVMKGLRILLLDGTAIRQAPQLLPSGMNGLSLLTRLCLNGNDVIQTLQDHIGLLNHLKCLDLKYCKNLTSVPTLPPNLQCFDAHGCESLMTVASPLAFLNLTDQISSTFIFSHCNNLDEVSKSCIISYIQAKSQLLSNALNRYNLGSVMESYTETCFPGCEVPEWFSHQANSSVLHIDLARTRTENRITGVALCAVVSFQIYRNQKSGFLVKCTCQFNDGDGSFWGLSCTLGGTAGPGIEPRKIESDHVFVCYKSLLQIKKQSKAEEKKVLSSTKASLRFEVIDGAGELVKATVLRCGFSMVYEPEGTGQDNVFWGVNSDVSSMVDDNIHYDEPMPSATQIPDEISDYDDEEFQEEDEEHGTANVETNHDLESHQNMADRVTPSDSYVDPSTEVKHECNSSVLQIFKGEVTLEETPSMSLEAASEETQPTCNSGVSGNFNGDAMLESSIPLEATLDETQPKFNPLATENFNGEDILEATPSMPLKAATEEITPSCNSGATQNFNGEATLEATTIISLELEISKETQPPCNSSATEKFNGDPMFEATPSMPFESPLEEIQETCNSGTTENFNGEPNLEAILSLPLEVATTETLPPFNSGVTEKFNGEAMVKAIISMPFQEALNETRPICNSGASENFNGEAILEATPSMPLEVATKETLPPCNSGATEKFNGEAMVKVTSSMSLQAASKEIQPECNLSLNEIFNGETALEATPNMPLETASEETPPTCNSSVTKNFSGEAMVIATRKMSVEATAKETLPECDFGVSKNSNGETRCEAPSSMQNLNVTQTRAGKNKVINGKEYTSCFPCFHSSIFRLRKRN